MTKRDKGAIKHRVICLSCGWRGSRLPQNLILPCPHCRIPVDKLKTEQKITFTKMVGGRVVCTSKGTETEIKGCFETCGEGAQALVRQFLNDDNQQELTQVFGTAKVILRKGDALPSPDQ